MRKDNIEYSLMIFCSLDEAVGAATGLGSSWCWRVFEVEGRSQCEKDKQDRPRKNMSQYQKKGKLEYKN